MQKTAEGGRPPRGRSTAIAALRPRLAAAGLFARYALHRFNRDGCFLASGSLSYTTLVSLVPLGVVGLGVLSAFPVFAGMRQQLLNLIFRSFVPSISEQAVYWFQTFAASATQTTAIGIIGIAGTGILLMVTVEDQLNALWRVTTSRPWSQRVLAYWTLMTLGPLLVGLSLTLSTYLDTAARRAGLSPEALAHYTHYAGSWTHYFARALPFVLELIACTLLYCLIPNCTVRWRDGLAGGAVAAVAVELLKIGFAIYIGHFASYQTVYGALAAIPIFLLWMYVSWNAVLLGAVVTANLPTWRVDERLAHIGAGGVRLGFGLALIAALARAQRHGAACRIGALSEQLGVPTSIVDEHLQQLARGGFTVATQDGGWVLAWNLDDATLHDLYVALGLPLAGTWLARPLAPWQQQVAAPMERIVATETAAMQRSLASLLAEGRADAAPAAARAVAEHGTAE